MTRYLLYSHDTYGLGHFRRCSQLATAIVRADRHSEVLIVTGSPRAQAFQLPDRVDTIKLPSATKDERGHYRPRKLGGGIDDLIRLRSDIITSTALAFEPDVILVDHSPTGMGGELLAMLDHLDRRPTRPRLALGLRDVIDEAGRVDAAWHRDGTWIDLDRYDQILVYGDESVTTTATELGLSRRVTAPVTHTGYIAPTMPEPLAVEPFLLVTSGGGGDGQGLLRRYLDGVAAGATGDLRSIVVTGPLLSAGRRAEIMTRAADLPTVEVVEFTSQLRDLIASATGVVSMAGYNTVTEELMADTPALLVPRCSPRLEQLLRARRLCPRTSLEHVLVEALNPERLSAFVDRCTSTTNPSTTSLSTTGSTGAGPGVAVDGLANTIRALMSLARADHPATTLRRLANAR